MPSTAIRLAALLVLLWGCAPATPEPKTRYPSAEFPGMAQRDVAQVFVNVFHNMAESEKGKEWNQVWRRHSVVSADENLVLVKSENPDGFRRPGYIKLYIEPRQQGGSVVVGSRMTYVQNAESTFEQEHDIYGSLASVRDPAAFVNAYQNIFDAVVAKVAEIKAKAAGVPK